MSYRVPYGLGTERIHTFLSVYLDVLSCPRSQKYWCLWLTIGQVFCQGTPAALAAEKFTISHCICTFWKVIHPLITSNTKVNVGCWYSKTMSQKWTHWLWLDFVVVTWEEQDITNLLSDPLARTSKIHSPFLDHFLWMNHAPGHWIGAATIYG